MKTSILSIVVAGFCISAGSAALADCKGSLGRGWGGGNGDGKYQLPAGEAACNIGFPSFIDDAAKTSIPATEVKLTRGPKNGTIGVTAKGLVYTPKAGFKGSDKFCIRNTTPKVKGKSLSGCVTVTVG